MTVRNCPASVESGCRGCRGFRVMYDRRRAPFVVDCAGKKDGGSQSGAQIYNYLPLYLADRLEDCRETGFPHSIFYRRISRSCSADILKEYRKGGRRDGITRGLYYRHIK